MPKKVIFENEEIKKTMLGTSGNPFHLAYLVDVETVEDKPVLYKITTFHESFEKPEK